MTLVSPRRAAVVASLIAMFGFGVWIGGPARKREPDPPVMLREIQALSELVTMKYIMSKVVTHEIEKTFGRDKILLVAQGVVKGGIDFGKMTADDIQASGNVMTIRLPKSTITDYYLDEKGTFVYDRRTGFFTAPDKNLESEARRIALAAILAGAHSGGIHKEADERARKLLVPLARRLGFENIVFQ